MSRFIVIDHSLRGAGGHHFEYASHVLCAAERAGYEPVLATNRHFRLATGYTAKWRILPIFRKSTYSRYTVFLRSPEETEAAMAAPRSTASPWSRLAGVCREFSRRYFRVRSELRSQSFAHGLRRLFHRVELTEGDHVFVPTISEIDLAGLARFLRSHPTTRLADWHLQFHFNLYHGREPDFARQSGMRDHLRRVFAQALEQIPLHRIHFYNTTEQLTAQFDCLGVAKFHTLPYPVNAALCGQSQIPATDRAPHPLRITSLGAMRTEKKSQDLTELLGPIWKSHFESGRCQLVLQSEDASPARSSSRSESSPIGGPLRWVPHPLPMDAYLELIRSADVGLLMYDGERYYARCSGVLVELLAAGRPVVVTAGSWMAEQIAEANFAHLDLAVRALSHLGSIPCGTSPSAVVAAARQGMGIELLGDSHPTRSSEGAGGRVTIDSGTAVCHDVPISPGTTHVLVSFQWREPTEHGTYLRLSCESDTTSPDADHPSSFVVGRRRRGPARVMFRVPPDAGKVRLTWTNAYAATPIVVQDARLDLLSAARLPNGFPLGAVGLIAADRNELPALVAEIADHWPHYRESARNFSTAWAVYHSADKLVSELMRCARSVTNRAWAG